MWFNKTSLIKQGCLHFFKHRQPCNDLLFGYSSLIDTIVDGKSLIKDGNKTHNICNLQVAF